MARVRRPLFFALIYVALIFIASSIPSLKPPGPDFVPVDKIAHVVEYFILGVLLFKGIGWTMSRSRAATFGFIVTVGVSIGALDEIYQSYVPGRMMSILDWYADALGTAAGSGLFIFTGLGSHARTAKTTGERREGEGEIR